MNDPKELILKLLERIESIDKTLVRNTVTLEEHMRRSEANEEAVSILSTEVVALREHAIKVSFLGTLSMWLLGSGILGIVLKFVIFKG